MARVLRFPSFLLLPIFIGISSLAAPVVDTTIDPVVHGIKDVSPRSTNTCADPSLTRTIFQAFNSGAANHPLGFREVFVNADTQAGSGPPAVFTLQGAVFKAWPAQQNFTVPLFRMDNSATSDVIFEAGVDAQTPPIVAGYSATSIVAWVYNTAICGSVPLLRANFAAQTDHYHTTDPLEHAGLLAAGWTDSGAVAFVLPLS